MPKTTRDLTTISCCRWACETAAECDHCYTLGTVVVNSFASVASLSHWASTSLVLIDMPCFWNIADFNLPTCVRRLHWGWSRWNFTKIFVVRKLESIVRLCLRDPTFSRCVDMKAEERHKVGVIWGQLGSPKVIGNVTFDRVPIGLP